MANKLVAASHSFFFFESNGCKSLIVVGFESMPSFLQKKKNYAKTVECLGSVTLLLLELEPYDGQL